MYLRVVDGVPRSFSLAQLATENPEVSFPDAPSAGLLAEYSVYAFYVPDPPSFDQLTQQAVQGSFAQDQSGNWYVPWVVENLPVDQASANVRAQRDRLLAESDWVIIKATETGQPVPPEWLAYRQALRDITKQEGFPYAVVWPVKPV